MDPIATETTWVSDLIKVQRETREFRDKIEKLYFFSNGWRIFLCPRQFSEESFAKRMENCRKAKSNMI